MIQPKKSASVAQMKGICEEFKDLSHYYTIHGIYLTVPFNLLTLKMGIVK